MSDTEKTAAALPFLEIQYQPIRIAKEIDRAIGYSEITLEEALRRIEYEKRRAGELFDALSLRVDPDEETFFEKDGMLFSLKGLAPPRFRYPWTAPDEDEIPDISEDGGCQFLGKAEEFPIISDEKIAEEAAIQSSEEQVRMMLREFYLAPFAELEARLIQDNRPDDSQNPTTLESVPTSDSAPPLGRVGWKGSKTDLGRVYQILGPLLDCTRADWERHFIGPNGQSMRGATDMHNAASTSGRSEINALTREVHKMGPEPD